MGIFDRFITKEILITTFFAVVMLCGVFLMGTIFKQARPLLVGKNPSFYLLAQFIITVLPLSLMFMLPCSFLAAILITFGRLSSQNELTAIQMSGRSLYRVSVPIFVVAIGFSAFCYFVNTDFAPRSKAIQKRILFEAVQTDPNKFLDPGVVQHQLKNEIVFVERRDEDKLYGLHVYSIDPDKKEVKFPVAQTYAEEAYLHVDEEAQELRLRIEGATMGVQQKKNERTTPFTVGTQEPLVFDFNKDRKKRIRVSSMTSAEIQQTLKDGGELVTPKIKNSLINEYYGRLSFSFSCVALAFVGVPLAISKKRRETSTGFVIAIGVAVLYFSFFIVANDDRDGDFVKIQTLYWLPNLLAVGVGVWDRFS